MSIAAATDKRDSIIRDNDSLRLYYESQMICPAEDLPLMWAAFKTELPITFRLTCSGDLARATAQYYDEEALVLASEKENAQGNIECPKLDRPEKIDIIPQAYRMSVLDRRSIRKNESAKRFRTRVIDDSERGALQRQELVSMIPPLFLKVTPQDRVIDLCAAPGSKTTQMIDSIHRALNLNGLFRLSENAAVLANDVNIDRARLLSHQLGKVASPVVATVCADALGFPKADSVDTLFTKVLCDVPCSGDGTLRKNPEIWREWSVKQGLDLHSRQYKILERGLELLAPGGRLVYSTCSLNPIEDEAVVAAALSKLSSELELLDVFEQVPNLPGARGLQDWKVPDLFAWTRFATDVQIERKINASTQSNSRKKRKILKHTEKLEGDALKRRVQEIRQEAEALPLFCEDITKSHDPDLLVPTMFASTYEKNVLEQLRKTARFMPQQQLNSGGFFCALFQRRSDSQLPIRKRPRKHAEDVLEEDKPEKTPTRKTYDDVVKPLPLEKRIAEDIIRFYGLSATVDSESTLGEKGLIPKTEALTRTSSEPAGPSRDLTGLWDLRVSNSTGEKTQWLYTNGNCDKRVLLASPKLLELQAAAKNLDFISVGSKVFEKLDERFRLTSGCDYRVTNDAAVWLLGYMRRRVICCTYQSVIDSLTRDGLTRAYILELEASGRIWNLDSCRREGLLESGGCVLIADGDKGLIRLACLMSGNGNVLPLLKKCLRSGFIQMLSEGRRHSQNN